MYTAYHALIEKLHNELLCCTEPGKRQTEEGWSIKEIIGHLIDSASNNHQRFLRYLPGGNLHFPAYNQNDFVARAEYHSHDFQSLVSLWYEFNRLLLHVFRHVPADDLKNSTVSVGDKPPAVLSKLIDDYFSHMEKHLGQIERIIRA